MAHLRRFLFSPLIFVALFSFALCTTSVVYAAPDIAGYADVDLDDIDVGVPLEDDAHFLATRPDAIELARRSDMRRLATDPVYRRGALWSSTRFTHRPQHRPDH